MRVLILNYEYPPLGGGAANATRYLIQELAKDPDLTLDLVTSSTGAARVESPAENTTLHFLDIGKNDRLHYQSMRDLLTYSWRALHYSRRLLRDQKFDVVHAFFGIPCGYLAMRLRLPYIVSLRGSDVPFYNRRFRLLDRLLFRRLSQRIWSRANFVIANSAGLRQLACQSAPAQAIDVIGNGVDTETFAPASARPQRQTLTLVSTGRLIARKGYPHLLEALKGRTSFSLCLIGDGPDREYLEGMAASLNLNVEFAGRQNQAEIASRLRKADIFVLPSLNEGMSNSVLEAMACGLPVIVSDTGGSAELVTDNGMITERGSSASLAAALDQYASDRELIKVHGLNSRARAEQMSWQKMADQYKALYQTIYQGGTN